MGAPRLQNWSPKGSRKRKLEKVTNTISQKVEKFKIMKMKRLKSEHVDISFILQQRLINPKKIEKLN